MRRLLCIVLLMAALPASAQAADPLAVKGGRLVDGRGRAVVLHGVNVVYKLAPYAPDFTRAEARRVRGWGMNAIRLGVSWRALEPARGTIDTAYVARVRTLVRRAGDEGLWVLIDMRQDRSLVPALHRADPSAPTFYEDWLTTDFGYPFAVHVGAANQGLSYHVYCGQPIRPDPCRTQEAQALANGVRNAADNHAAALVTEFGATDRLDILRRVADGADAMGVGWLYWQYKTYGDPTTSAAGEGPDAESLVTPAGAVKAAKVRELARAYPARIAGRGARWSYRASDGRFSLRWTAARLADTVVALPRLAYPRGFTVRAHGVRVVRRAPLTLRGSGRASITITRR